MTARDAEIVARFLAGESPSDISHADAAEILASKPSGASVFVDGGYVLSALRAALRERDEEIRRLTEENAGLMAHIDGWHQADDVLRAHDAGEDPPCRE